MTPGHEFLSKLESVEAEIRAQSEKITALQNALPEENREELSSQIDMAVGSGSLILKGKCKQFRELCLKNIAEVSGDCHQQNGGEQFPTTKDDLEGYWDMISLTIQNVMESFSAIERLKENDWREPSKDLVDCKKISQPKPAAPKKKPLASKNDSNDTSKHIEEARKRLLEAKRAAKDRLQNGESPKDAFIIE